MISLSVFISLQKGVKNKTFFMLSISDITIEIR